MKEGDTKVIATKLLCEECPESHTAVAARIAECLNKYVVTDNSTTPTTHDVRGVCYKISKLRESFFQRNFMGAQCTRLILR